MTNIILLKNSCSQFESLPFAFLGISGIVFVLIIPYFLVLNFHLDNEVRTISYTARKTECLISFGTYFVIIILFLSQCVLSGDLLLLFLIPLILLSIIVLCNPQTTDKTKLADVLRKVHEIMAIIIFIYLQVIAFILAIFPFAAFDGSTDQNTKALKAGIILLLFLQLVTFIGMFYIEFVVNHKETPDKKWSQTVSHLERLYILLFFIIFSLVPEATISST